MKSRAAEGWSVSSTCLDYEAAGHRIVAEMELAPGGVEALRVGEGGVHLRQHAGRRARRDAPGAVRRPEPAGRRVVAEIEGHDALVIGRNPVRLSVTPPR
jgi:hypothetical protein